MDRVVQYRLCIPLQICKEDTKDFDSKVDDFLLKKNKNFESENENKKQFYDRKRESPYRLAVGNESFVHPMGLNILPDPHPMASLEHRLWCTLHRSAFIKSYGFLEAAQSGTQKTCNRNAKRRRKRHNRRVSQKNNFSFRRKEDPEQKRID